MLEKIITLLAALVAAIEANTAAQLAGGTKSAKGAKPATPPADPAPADPAPEAPAGPTLEEIRAAANEILDKGGPVDGKKKLTEIVTKYGVKKISEVHGTDKAVKAYADMQAAIAKLDV